MHCVSVSVRTLCLCLCVCTVSLSVHCVCVFALCVSVRALCQCSYLVFDRRRSCLLSHVRWQRCCLPQVYNLYIQRLYYYQMGAWSGVGAQVVSTVAQKHVNWPVRQRHCEQLVQSLRWWCSQKMRARTTDVEFTELSLRPRENFLPCMFFAQITLLTMVCL